MSTSSVWPVCSNRDVVVRRLVMAGNAAGGVADRAHVMATGTGRATATFISRAVTERTHAKIRDV